MSDQSAIKLKQNSSTHWEQLHAIALHPNSELAASSGSRPDKHAPQITVFSTHDGATKYTLTNAPDTVTSLLFANDKQIVAGHENGQVSIWAFDKKNASPTTLDAHSDAVTALAVSADGKTFFSCGKDGRIRGWSVTDGQSTDVQYVWPAGVPAYTLVADPKGGWLAAAGEDAIIRVFDQATGEVTREMPGHNGAIYTMIMHPHEYRLISAGEDRSIMLWYLQGEVEFEDRAPKDTHEAAIRSMALGPIYQDANGEDIPPRLFTSSDDKTIKIWPLANKRKPKTITDGKGVHTSLVALKHDDGTRLLSANIDRHIRGWQCNDQTELQGLYLDVSSAFHTYAEQLENKRREQREKALQVLKNHLRDGDVFDLLLYHLQADSAEEVRKLAADILATATHRKPIDELRKTLNDSHFTVRVASFEALRVLQGQQSLSPFTSALKSNEADLRKLAVQELVELYKSSPRAQRLILSAFDDHKLEVQVAALDALESIYPSTKTKPEPKPLILALRQGSNDLKLEAIRRIYRYQWAFLEELRPILTGLLDDSNESLRRLTFEVMIAAVPPLAKALSERDEHMDRALQELEETQSEEEEKPKKTKAKKKKPEPFDLSDEQLQPLLLGVSSHNTDIALRAAASLARLQDLRAFGTLLQLSHESNTTFRKETAQAFANLGDVRGVDCLVGMLDDDQKEVRDVAFDSLSSLVSKSLEFAQLGLGSQQADIRSRTLQKLAPKGKKAPSEEAIALLLESLNDDSSSVHDEAFKILWNIFESSPEKCLVPSMKARPENLRIKAMDESLAFKGEGWVHETFVELLSDRNESIRHYAYSSLQKLYKAKDPGAHAEALKVHFAQLRRVAVNNLHSYPDKAVRPLLLEALNDQDLETRKNALDAILQRFSKDADLLAETLKVEHWDIRLQTAHYLAEVGDERALQVAADYLAEEQQALKSFAEKQGIEATSEKELMACFAKLPQKEQTQRADYREKIIKLLQVLRSPSCVQHLKVFLATDDLALLRKALQAIVYCADASHTELFESFLKHEDAELQRVAAEGLARQGSSKGAYIFKEQTSISANKRAQAFYALDDKLTHRWMAFLSDNNGSTRGKIFQLLLAKEYFHSVKGQAPDLLMQALRNAHDEIRLQAAEALEKRPDREAFQAYVIDVLMKNAPSGNSDKDKEHKAFMEKHVPKLLDSLNSDSADTRYEAVYLLFLLNDPEHFAQYYPRRFRHVKVGGKPRAASKDKAPESPELEQIVFGAYVGLIRQSSVSWRLKIKAIEGLQRLGALSFFQKEALLPTLQHAMNDSNNSDQRKAALKAVQSLFEDGALTPYSIALLGTQADVGSIALDALVENNSEEAKQLAIKALQSPVKEIRIKASESLQAFYGEESLEPFILALGSEYSDVRLRVVNKLLDSEDPRVIHALSEALLSDDDQLRLKAAEALANRNEAKAFDFLVEFLYDENQNIQRRAAQSLVQLKVDNTYEAFTQRIEEDPEGTADINMLIRSIGDLGDTKASEWLIAQLERDYYQRHAAFESLLKLAGPSKTRDDELYVNYLERALQSKSQDIREASVEKLRKVERPEVQAILAKLLYDRNEELRRKACEVIAFRIPKYDTSIEPLKQSLSHSDPAIRLEAAVELANHDVQEAFPVLLTTYQTSLDSSEQIKAVDALGILGDARALEYLMPLFEPEADYHAAQNAAAEALGRLATPERAVEIRGILNEQMSSYNTDMRCRALIGLRYLAGEEALSVLINAIKQANDWSGWSVRQTGAEQLGEIGSPEAESTLVALLEDNYTDVRNAAFDALMKIHGESSLTPHMLVFDSPNIASYDTEKRKKSAKVIATQAPAVDILRRLPTPGFAVSDSDMFLHFQSTSVDWKEENEPERPYVNDELRRILVQGLLEREVSPVDGLLASLEDDYARVRLNAAYILVQLGDHKAAKGLEETLQKVNASWKSEQTDRLIEIWNTSLWALEQLAPEKALESSLSALQADNTPAKVLAQASQNLGKAKNAAPKGSTEALQNLLEHPTEKVRRNAVWAISQIEEDTSTLLVSLPRLPGASRHLLPAEPAKTALTAEQWTSHTAMRDLVPQLIAKGQSGLFAEWLSGEQDEQTQNIAIQALSQIADETAIHTLDSIRQNDNSPQAIRIAAYRAWRRALRQRDKRTAQPAS
ncbi:MAG: hypothetical protein CL920_34200 [Deltaproteobacteria bacterium]|nr:hypothetical protein [Deltaproteobacteria bacterium]MBU53776.1 hypothetical protein [Deltaproteobacteria bacterium]